MTVTTMSPSDGEDSAAVTAGAVGAVGAFDAATLGVGVVSVTVGAGRGSTLAGSGVATTGLARSCGSCAGSVLSSCCGCVACGSSFDRMMNHAPPMMAAAAMSRAIRDPPDELFSRSLVLSVARRVDSLASLSTARSCARMLDVCALGDWDFGPGAVGSDLGAGRGAVCGVGDGAFAFASASVVSQLSSSGVGGGLDEGIDRGVGDAGIDAGAAAVGVDDVANAGADDVAVDVGAGDAAADAGAGDAAADAGASQFSSSSARIGGGQDIGIERGADDTDMGFAGARSAGIAAGSIDGDGIPISVEPLPVFLDTGAAVVSLSASGCPSPGAGIPSRVGCREVNLPPGRELTAWGAVEGFPVEGLGSCGFDSDWPKGAGGAFEVRSSLMA